MTASNNNPIAQIINNLFGFFFTALNGVIFLSGFLLIEIEHDARDHFDHKLKNSSLIVRHHNALAITWFDTSLDKESHFPWTAVGTLLTYAHSVFLIAAPLIVISSWPFQRSPIIFTTYCLLLSTAILLRVFVITSCLEPSSRLFTTTLNSALSELEWKYRILSNSSYVSAMNTYMIKGQCCGINGPFDFNNINLTVAKNDFLFPYNPDKSTNLYFPPGRVNYNFRIPPACCKPHIFNLGNGRARFEAVKTCAMGTDVTLQNREGCLHRLERYVKGRRNFIAALMTSLFTVEICALTIAFYFTFTESKNKLNRQSSEREQSPQKILYTPLDGMEGKGARIGNTGSMSTLDDDDEDDEEDDDDH